MNLENKFKELQNKGEGAHMPHVYYGDPHEEFSLKLLETLVGCLSVRGKGTLENRKRESGL